MDHYIDIQLLPDPEFTSSILMSALFGKLHRALVALRSENLGVSFPQYQLKPKTVGNVLRIHGTVTHLSELMQVEWLKGMSDHASVTKVCAIPQGCQHRVVNRRQFKTNVERMRRRRMKRKGETYEEAYNAIPESVVRQPELPFVTLTSHSSGQKFCMFIDLGDLCDEAVSGAFNHYGFGRQATVPWF